ncbi:MAG: RDD family protein [Roseibacillus sp.]
MNRNRFSAVATISVPTLGIKGKKITNEERYLETIDPAPATPAGEPLGEIEVEVSEEMVQRLKLGWSIEVAKNDSDNATDTTPPLLLETTYPKELVAPTLNAHEPAQEQPSAPSAFDTPARPRVFNSALHLFKASLPIQSQKRSPSNTLLLSTTHPSPLPTKANSQEASPKQKLSAYNEDNNTLVAAEATPDISERGRQAPVLGPLSAPESATQEEPSSETSPQSSGSTSTDQIGLIATALFNKAAQEHPQNSSKEFVTTRSPADVHSSRLIQSETSPADESLVARKEEPTAPKESAHLASSIFSVEEINPDRDTNSPTPSVQPLPTTEEGQTFGSKTKVQGDSFAPPHTNEEHNGTLEATDTATKESRRSGDTPLADRPVILDNNKHSHSPQNPPSSEAAPKEGLRGPKDKNASPSRLQTEGGNSLFQSINNTSPSESKAPTGSATFQLKNAQPPNDSTGDDDTLIAPTTPPFCDLPTKREVSADPLRFIEDESQPPHLETQTSPVESKSPFTAKDILPATPPSLQLETRDRDIAASSNQPSPPAEENQAPSLPEEPLAACSLSQEQSTQVVKLSSPAFAEDNSLATEEENPPDLQSEQHSSLFRSRSFAALIDVGVASSFFVLGLLLFPNPPRVLPFVFAALYLLTKDSLGILNGQSIGKKFMKLRTVNRNNRSLSGNYKTGLLRNLSWLVAPIEFAILYVREDEESKGKRLGDDWAKTQVLPERESQPRKSKWLP